MITRPVPTIMHLHLSLAYGDDFTIFTDGSGGPNSKMKEYPYICSIEVDFGIKLEDIQAQYATLKIGSLYRHAGELQAQLDAVKEEIQKLQAIGYDSTPVGVHPAEWEASAPRPAPVNDFDKFDDDIPF
jgi:hypothetical protein